MQAILTIAIIIVCVLLILVVLVQNSKGGGISSNFSAANQIMGAFSLLSTPKTGGVTERTDETEGSITKAKAGGAVMPAAQPAQQAPAAQPAAPTTTP